MRKLFDDRKESVVILEDMNDIGFIEVEEVEKKNNK